MMGADGTSNVALQMMINVGQNLLGLDITMERMDAMKNKARILSIQVANYFRNMKTKVQMYLAKMKTSLVNFGNAMVSVANKAKMAFLIVIAVTGLLGNQLTKLGGNAEEMEAKFKVVFGNMTKDANKWINKYSELVGMSKYGTKEVISGFQNIFVGFGMSRKMAFEFSKSVVTLTNDLASMNNLDPTEAGRLMMSSLMGQAMAAKRLGGALTETQLDLTSLELGFGKYSTKMDEGMKMIIRYQTLLRQNQDALGNRQDTRGSYTNQMREFKGNIKDASTELGLSLLPTMTKFLLILNRVDWTKVMSEEKVKMLGKMTIGILGILGALYLIPKAFVLISMGARASIFLINGSLFLMSKMVAMVTGTVALLGVAFTAPTVPVLLLVALVGTAMGTMTYYIANGTQGWRDDFGEFFRDIELGFQIFMSMINKARTSMLDFRINNAKNNLRWTGTPMGPSEEEAKELRKKIQILQDKKNVLENYTIPKNKQRINRITDINGEDYINDVVLNSKKKLGEIIPKVLEFVKDGTIKIGESIGASFESILKGLPQKLKEQVEQFDRGDVLAEWQKMVNGLTGGKGGGAEFSVDNLPMKEQLNRIKMLGDKLGKTNVEIIQDQISLYENAMQGMFSKEVIDYGKVDKYQKALENLNAELNRAESVENFKNKMKSLFDNLNLNNINQSQGSMYSGALTGVLQESLAVNLFENVSTELGGLIQEFKEGIKFTGVATQEEINKLLADIDKMVLTKYPNYRKESKNSIDAMGQLADLTYRVGEAFENELLTGISAVAGLISQLPSLLEQINGGASTAMSGIGLLAPGSAFATGLGVAALGVAVFQTVDGIMSGISAEDDERNARELEKYNEQLGIMEKGNQLLERIDGSVRSIHNSLVSNLSNNPTLGNLKDGKGVYNQMYSAIQNGFNVGNLSYVEYWKKSGGMFGGTRRKKTTRTLDDNSLYQLLGLDFSGAIEKLDLSQLKEISNRLNAVNSGVLESLVKGEKGFSLFAETMFTMFSGGTYLGLKAMFGLGNSWKFKGIEKETSQQLKGQIDRYIAVLEGVLELQAKLFEEATLEAFQGVSISDTTQLRSQFEEFYKDLGLNPSDYKKAIDEMVEANKVTYTAMEEVRSSFLEIFTDGGETASNAFYRSFTSYWEKIQNNIAQVFYDTTFSDVTDKADALFETFSIGLVNIKKTGGDLDQYVGDFFKGVDASNLVTELLAIRDINKDFKEFTDLLENTLREMGFTTIELIPILRPEIIENLKNSLSNAMNKALEDQNFISFNQTLGQSIYDSVKSALVKAFVDSAIYQQLLEKFFDLSNVEKSIENATSFEDAFNMISAKLKDVESELKSAGFDFTSDDGTGSVGEFTPNDPSDNNGSANIGYTDYGQGQIIKNYKIEIKGNTIYGDSENIRELALKLRDELDKIDEIEK